jgi:glycine cleavage system H lipoate-binding protein
MGWLVEVKLSRPEEAGALLSAADYQELLHG